MMKDFVKKIIVEEDFQDILIQYFLELVFQVEEIVIDYEVMMEDHK